MIQPVRPILLTGGSGFAGRKLLELLARTEVPDVRILTRNPDRLPAPRPFPGGWRVITGDLSDPGAWSAHLRGVETIVHLAASTGKTRRAVHLHVNLEGTRRLLEQAKEAGVARFLFVSSIAAGYRDRPHYHYAEAKAAAEALVCGSELDWLIIRPTVVLGPGSPALASLRRLALFPVPLVFGAGTNQVQPIHRDDLAALLLGALATTPWGGRTIAAGGPERLTTEELLARIRAVEKREQRRFLHLPLRPIRGLLGLLEPLLLPMLPLTAGQLAIFANPCVADPDPLLARLPAPRLGVAAMLSSQGPG